MAQNETEPRLNDIAIIAMTGRFPGAPDVETLWRNLREGVESVARFDEEALRASGVAPDLIRNPHYVPARAMLDDVELFDAGFFGIYPSEAELMDPQHRLFLEEAWRALETAGYDSEQYDGAIGLFAGAGLNTYLLNNLVPNGETTAGDVYKLLLSSDKDFLPTRVSYKLNLTGPSVNVQTACSTSLVAVHLACQSLLNQECDMALAGGVSVAVPMRAGYLYAEGMILSPDGHCRPFDAGAGGIVPGNGVALVALKRLDDALADRDNILAVIRGSAINNDGSAKIGYTAPSVEGQSAVIAQAMGMAEVEPETIGYVEAHGTGTELGDPIEVEALKQVFGAAAGKETCALGSVKSNFGHLDAAAGATGLIKAILALQNGEIPPTVHFEKLNPKIGFEGSPFYVNRETRAWPRLDGLPRRAGVSSFGIGGTNAHVVLEEAPAFAKASAGRPVSAKVSADRPGGRPHYLLPLSAATETALETATQNLAAFLKEHPETNLADAAWTLQVGRRAMPHRRFIVARDLEEAAEALANGDARRIISHRPAKENPPVVFMFSGQGAQHPGMARGLYETEPLFRAEVDRCCEMLIEHLGFDLRDALFPAEENAELQRERLDQTFLAQPALFVVEYALARLLTAWSVKPDAMVGHSIGEYAAACLAGVFSLDDALALVAARGKMMQKQPPGAMLAVSLEPEDLQTWLPPGIEIAAVNAPNRCVVSGRTPLIEMIEQRFETENVPCRRLQTSHAFHSPMMAPLVEAFAERVKSIEPRAPEIPFASNVTGTWITAEQATDPQYWALHLRRPVRFADDVAALAERCEGGVFIEIGPGNALTTLASQNPRRDRMGAAIPSLPHPKATAPDTEFFAGAVGRLWLHGVRIDWAARAGEDRPRRIPLPTYPFERKRYWIEPPQVRAEKTVRADRVERAEDAREKMQAAPEPMQAGTPAPQVAANRQVLAALKELFAKKSGMDVERIDENLSFMELGADSLFLVDFAQAIEKRFDHAVSFRRMLEETPTLALLAADLEAKLPPEAVPEPDRAGPAARDAGAGEKREAPFSDEHAAPTEAEAFGPYAPRRPGSADGLTEAQERHLKELIGRYNRRTMKSKVHAERTRRVMADLGTSYGYAQRLKEMIYPVLAERSQGARLWDIDGNEYLDMLMGFGVHLFGHSPEFIHDALKEQIDRGLAIGPQPEQAERAAALICEMVGVERAAFCNTGSEAVMTAIRLARAVTGRSKLVMFAGSYHGNFDEVLLRPLDGGPEAVTVAPGIVSHFARDVWILPYGDYRSLDFIRRHGEELAAVLVEPVQSRQPELQPKTFLQDLRHATRECGAALIFDEMLTGFRSHPRGAQGLFDVRADIATYGKVVGGGLPIGVVAGEARFLDAIDGGMWHYGDGSHPAPTQTFFAGTFCKHPLAMTAACRVLERLREAGPALQEELTQRAASVADDLNRCLKASGAPVEVRQFASLLRLNVPPNVRFPNLLFHHLLDRGVYLWPQFSMFLSTAHTEADLRFFVDAVRQSVEELQAHDFFQAPAEGARPAMPEPGAEIVEIGEEKPLPPPSEAIPITEPQREIWIESQMGTDASCAFNLVLPVRFDGSFHEDALRRVIQGLVDRHEALRTRFSPRGDVQEFLPEARLDIPLIDLSHLDAMEKERSVAELLEAEEATPFDYAGGLFLRAKIARLAEDRHLLILVTHHIVCDGWSTGILLQELGALYRAEQEATVPDLPAPRPYAEFARWQQSQENAPETRANEAYWLDLFREIPPPLELPTDRPRPPVKTFRGDSIAFKIPRQLYEGLVRRNSSEGVTMFTSLLALFQTLLHRLSGQDDLVVGIPVAGQNLVGGGPLVGHCVNLLPLRSRLSGTPTLAEHLGRTRRAVLDAFEHQNYTFGRLVRKLAIPHDPSRSPLINVIFNVDRMTPAQRLNELNIEVQDMPKRFGNFDLSVNIIDRRDSLKIGCQFNTDLFDRATLTRWMRYFQRLIEAAVEDVRTPVSELPLMTEAERRTLRERWNAADAAYPRDAAIHELFEAQAAQTPDALALIDGEERVAYRDLNERANRLAHYLQSRGAVPETPVGVCMERSAETVAALLAILKTGGAWVPLDPHYPAHRLAHILQDSHVPMVLTKREWLRSLPEGGAEIVCLDGERDAIDACPAENLSIATSAERPAYILYTSGSTGEPKGVVGLHRGAVNRFAWMWREYPFEPGEKCCWKTSLNFVDSVWEIFGPLLKGVPSLILDDASVQDVPLLIERLAEERATRIVLVPSLLKAMLEGGGEDLGERLPNLRLWVSSGEPLSRELYDRFRAAVPEARLLNLYGSTEVSADVTCFDSREGGDEPGPVPIGKPIANTKIHILDRHMQPVPVGVPGEIYVAGDGLALGYWRRPDLTGERFVANPFDAAPHDRLYRTGDLGRYRPDGAIEYLGRTDRQIKISGFRIEPAEIESALHGHPQIDEAVVVARDLSPGDAHLVAYVTASSGLPAVGELREFLAERLPPYMIPSVWMPLDAFPLTPSGKIDRRALPAPDAAGLKTGSEFARPRTPTESTLAEIWAEVLPVDVVGARDNFFELGGHSLMATQVISRIREIFRIELPMRALFERPTVAALASAVDELLRGDLPAVLAPPMIAVGRDRELPLSFSQERMWFMQQFDPESTAYNLATAVRIMGNLDHDAMVRSWRETISRHESLRTTFSGVDGRPVQEIGPEFDPPLRCIDLRDRPESEREAEALRILREDCRLPFDLSQAPLFRLILIRLDDGSYISYMNMHHIIADQWSFGVLGQELFSLYAHYDRNEPLELSAMPIQYADFALWQRQWLQGDVLERQLDYWRGKLQGLPALDLPLDRPRPAVQSFEGRLETVEIPAELMDKIHRLGMKEGVTLFMTFLAAFKALLHRYTGQEDIVLGSPIANRNRLETENLIGTFVNTLVLRTDLSENPTFEQLLARVRETALEAYAHQDLPFEKLVSELTPTRDMSHAPLVQALFNLVNAPQEERRFPDLTWKLFDFDRGAAQFDLTLTVEPHIERKIHVEYRADLFDPATIRRMLKHYLNLLEAAAEEPDRPLSEFSFLDPGERRTLIEDWNATHADYPRERGLHELFEEQAERTPDAVAVVFEDDRLTYGELNRRANRIAHHLKTLNVGPGDLVGICVERSLDMMAGLFGILKSGAAYVPIDPAFPRERVAMMLEDSAAPVLLTQQALLEALPEHAARVVLLDRDREEIVRHPDSNPERTAGPDDLAYVIFTSGSTGRPKGVQIPHRALTNFLNSMSKQPGLGAADVLLAVTTLSFDIAGLELFLPLIVGARVVLARREVSAVGEDLIRLMEAHGVTVMQATPSTWRILIQAGWAGRRELKALCGGEAMPPELVRPLLERVGELWNMYGPTETTIWSTIFRIDSPEAPILIGRPIDNTQVYILDRHRRPVPAGIAGELWIGGDGVARGYLNRPDLTEERFIPDPFGDRPGARIYNTGDIARWTPDGAVECLGRSDHQVKIRGYRIELGEIEATLAEHPEVQKPIVVAREDAPGDRRLAAYFVPEAGRRPTARDLRNHLKKTLPDYMIPSVFIAMEGFPLTPNGKIDRKTLPAPDAGRAETGAPFAAPRTPIEKTLAEIWKDILRVEKVGVKDNFFELGGHSLLATRVISRARAALGVELSLRALFESPTVEDLALAVAQLQAGQVDRDEMERMIEEIKGLSDDDLKARLEQTGSPKDARF